MEYEYRAFGDIMLTEGLGGGDLPQQHFFHQKPNKDWSGMESGPTED
jgi:hypothetical protein